MKKKTFTWICKLEYQSVLFRQKVLLWKQSYEVVFNIKTMMSISHGFHLCQTCWAPVSYQVAGRRHECSSYITQMCDCDSFTGIWHVSFLCIILVKTGQKVNGMRSQCLFVKCLSFFRPNPHVNTPAIHQMPDFKSILHRQKSFMYM